MSTFNFNISGLNLVKNSGASTDNSIARFNGTTGKEIQNSDVQLDDNGAFQNVDALVMESTPETAAGERVVRWNDTDGTIDIGLKGGNVTLQVGQESLLRAKSASSSGLVNGSAYRFVGSDGANSTVELAQANASTALNTVGIATESATGGNNGFITTFGLVRDIDTSGLTEGDIVWLSASVAGGMTTTQPANPNYAIKLGYCVRSHASQGAVFVTVDQSENAITAGSIVNSADEKTTPVDADMVGLMDSEASNVLKKLSWSNIKATLKTYFDTLYRLSSDELRAAVVAYPPTTSNAFANVTGLAVTIPANSNYDIRIPYVFQCAGTTTGFNISMTISGSPTTRSFVRSQASSDTANVAAQIRTDDGGTTVTTCGAANTDFFGMINGNIRTSGSGATIQVRIARGGTSANITLVSGAIIASKNA